MQMQSALPFKKDGVSGFSLHEAGEEIRRLGIGKGYEPVVEYPVLPTGYTRHLRVDWVWLKRGQPIAAFEIEGENVPEKSLTVDGQKFHAIKAQVKGKVQLYIVTYNCRYTKDGWKKLRPRSRHLDAFVQRNSDVRVISADGLPNIFRN